MILALEKPLFMPGLENLKANRNQVIPYLDEHNAFSWLQLLSGRYPQLAREFRSVFISREKQGRPHLIMGLGNYLSIQILVSKSELVSNLYFKNQLVWVVKERLPLESMPYNLIFNRLSMMMEMIRGQIPEQYADIPLLGGWTCDGITDELQSVATFTLPQIVITGQESAYDIFSFTEAVVLPSQESVQSFGQRGNQTFRGSVAYVPEKAAYISNLNRILEKMDEKKLLKAVVTRKAIIDLDGNEDALQLIAKVSKQNYQEYSYYFQWNQEAEWVGVSPEVMMIKEKQTIVAKPLAGTRKISYGNKTEDEIMKELLSDEKEDIEHSYAVNLILEDIQELIVKKEITVSEKKTILKTPYAYHIKSNISAQVNAGVHSFDVLARMYPPATIWGIPREEAGNILRKAEPFKRELFSGGLGFCRVNDDSNFALAIRTACLAAGKLHVFAGSGIVRKAVPENEWKETETKMSPFLSAIEIVKEREGEVEYA